MIGSCPHGQSEIMHSTRVVQVGRHSGPIITHLAGIAAILLVWVVIPPLQAAPSGITLDPPNLHLPAPYVLASDPARSNLTVRVTTVVNRNEICPTRGNLLAPCPPEPTGVRITVGIGTGGRPQWTAESTLERMVPGVASIPIEETLHI